MEPRSGPSRREVLQGAAAMTIGLALGAVRTPAAAADELPAAAGLDAPPALERRGRTLTLHGEFGGPDLDTSLWIPRYLGFRMPPDVGNTQFRFENGAIVLSITADTPPFGSRFSRPKEQVSSIQTAQGDYNQGSFVVDHVEPP